MRGFRRRSRPTGLRGDFQDPLYGYQAVNVEAQERDAHSLLNWTRRLVRVRKSSRVFSRGALTFLRPTNHRVLAYLRTFGREQVLVVNNLARRCRAGRRSGSAATLPCWYASRCWSQQWSANR